MFIYISISSSLSLYTYTYVYVCMYVCMYIYIYLSLSLYIYIYIYILEGGHLWCPDFAYYMMKKVFSPAREYMFWTTGALMQARTPFHNIT